MAQTRGIRTVGKGVVEMRIAGRAPDFGAAHELLLGGKECHSASDFIIFGTRKVVGIIIAPGRGESASQVNGSAACSYAGTKVATSHATLTVA
jgi:hypothetical protein